MYSMMDFCFMCIKDYHSVFVDDRIMSQLEYLLPEITITRLSIPLRICSICEGCLNAFSRFKQRSIDSSIRLEAKIKKAQACGALYMDDIGSTDQQTEKYQQISSLETHLNVDNNMETSASQSLQSNEIPPQENLLDSELLDTSLHTDEDSLPIVGNEKPGATCQNLKGLGENAESVKEELQEVFDTQIDTDGSVVIYYTETSGIQQKKSKNLRDNQRYTEIDKEMINLRQQDLQEFTIKEEQLDMASQDTQNIDGAFVENNSLIFDTQPKNSISIEAKQLESEMRVDILKEKNEVPFATNQHIKKVVKNTFGNNEMTNSNHQNLEEFTIKQEQIQMASQDIQYGANFENDGLTFDIQSKNLQELPLKNQVNNIIGVINDNKTSGENTEKSSSTPQYTDNINVVQGDDNTSEKNFENLEISIKEEELTETLKDKEFYDDLLQNILKEENNENDKIIMENNEPFTTTTANNTTNLNANINEKSVQIHQCTVCKKIFQDAINLQQHSNIHLHTDFICHVCDKKFPATLNLNQHLKKHSEQKEFQCRICHKLLTFRSGLYSHMKIHDKKNYCEVCNKSLATIYELNRHTKMHLRNKVIEQQNKIKNAGNQCTVCKKFLSSKPGLKRHLEVHKGVEKKFQCHICQKFFSYNQTLTTHIERVHKKIVNFPCYLCNELFVHKRTLNKHIKTHTVTDDYECKICNKLFGFELNLNEHMKSHSEVKYIR